MTAQHHTEAVVTDEEKPEIEEPSSEDSCEFGETFEFTGDLREYLEQFMPHDVVARGIPEDYHDYDEQYRDYYGSLKKSPPTERLDHVVLTTTELQEKWGCNLETLTRILENSDLRIEHNKLVNMTGTYSQLSQRFTGGKFPNIFWFDFFNLTEDAWFRATDIREFERVNRDIIFITGQKSPYPSEPTPSPEGSIPLTSVDTPLPPPDDSPPYDFSNYPQRAPEGQDLIDAIEQYLHDHPINLNNKGKVLDWVRQLTKDFEYKHPDLSRKQLWEALFEWRKVGAFVTSRPTFYNILGKKN
jgi:hypothetical protein